MEFVNEYKLIDAENYLQLLKRIKDLKINVWNVAKPRFQFNLRNVNNELKSYLGYNVFCYESEDTQTYCFRPPFYIKRELYDYILQEKDKIKILPESLHLDKKIEKHPLIYNNYTIYDKIDLKQKVEHCIVTIYNGDKSFMSEIPPVGVTLDGLPFSNDGKINEKKYCGYWIDGTSIIYFINAVGLGMPKELIVKVLYSSEEKDLL